MTLESIEKLRGYADVRWEPWAASRERLHEMLDAVEAEIAGRYIELPRDANGVPIRVGDYIIGVDDDKDTLSQVVYIAFDGAHWAVEEYFTEPPCFFPNFNDTKHASKPDPLIALLDEFATDIANYKVDGVDFDTYAERIRELLGVKS